MRKPGGSDLGTAIALVAAVTLVRVVVLVVTPLELHPDEAQYWWCSQFPQWGYFSKPPLTAWIIHVATVLFGDREWAIRIASPALHGLTALVIFAIGRRVFDSRTGLFASLAYATAPGVSYSAWLMSTDVPLLLCWALALYAFLRAIRETGLRWAVLCGTALGIGLLAKYAMLYFVLGMVIAIVSIARDRRRVYVRRLAVILPVAVLVLAPNLWWNAAREYPTIVHLERNADWLHARYSPAGLVTFLLGQFGVFGPLLMAGFLAAVFRLVFSRQRNEDEVVLAAVSVAPILVMLLQAFVVSANANWAAPAYVGASLLATRELMRWGRGKALCTSFVIDGAAMIMLWTALIRPELADVVGLGNAFKREEGWQPLAAEVRAVTARARYDAVAADNRSVTAELLYYARPLASPVRALRTRPIPHDDFQMAIPLPGSSSRVLAVVDPRDAPAVLAVFDSWTVLAVIAIPVGEHTKRLMALYDAHGYRGFASPIGVPYR